MSRGHHQPITNFHHVDGRDQRKSDPTLAGDSSEGPGRPDPVNTGTLGITEESTSHRHVHREPVVSACFGRGDAPGMVDRAVLDPGT